MILFWSSVKHENVLNIKSQNFCNISQLVQNGKTVQNPKDTATMFNQYFVNIGSKNDAEIPRTRKFLLDNLGRKFGSSFFFHSYHLSWNCKYHFSI